MHRSEQPIRDTFSVTASIRPAVDAPAPNATAGTVDLTAGIRNKHGSELNELREALIGSSQRGSRHSGRRHYRMSPTSSFEDENINVTIVVETVEWGWFAAGPTPQGTCVTVSIAAHRKDSGIQAPLSLAECDAWLRALLPSPWMPHVYRCRCSPGSASSGVVSYRLFLDARYKPTPKPAEVLAEGCQPLQLH
ncbi:hypothetical protein AB4Y87_23230 [Paenarthrobacter sp. RAF54_2]|uniref:hypothetical protein n=1 Tax=Paenarthrobacter sp. RAF54_2 TaxID=3233061 RepID=UPI003F9B6349